MLRKSLIILLMLISPQIFAGAQWAQDFYKKVSPIKIKEPLGVIVGSLNPEESVISISIEDVGLYTGHICPGVAAGFRATVLALNGLYGKETPVRGKIRIAANIPSDLLDVASYITGARAFYGRGEVNKNDIVIDEALERKPGIVVIVFQRKDTKKMVEVVFKKGKLFSPREMQRAKQMKKKIMEGRATKEEQETMKKIFQEKVKQILFNLPEGVITVKEIKDYNFPQREANKKGGK